MILCSMVVGRDDDDMDLQILDFEMLEERHSASGIYFLLRLKTCNFALFFENLSEFSTTLLHSPTFVFSRRVVARYAHSFYSWRRIFIKVRLSSARKTPD
jgi:hypothetical protein